MPAPAITLSTPSLLFSTSGLLMLAYTNRFTTLAALTRDLHSQCQQTPKPEHLAQIRNLRRRIHLIRDAQFQGILSLLLCVITMLLLFNHLTYWANWAFTLSLILFLVSLGLSCWEIHISTEALEVELSDINHLLEKRG